jgi:hypothetical protein
MSFSKGRSLRFLANVDPIDVARALQVGGRDAATGAATAAAAATELGRGPFSCAWVL